MEPEYESVSICSLPEEVLFKVMKLAGCFSTTNHDIRLVCKHFYKAYCAYAPCGLTFDSTKIGLHAINSMKHSLRRTTNFVIANCGLRGEGSILKEIVKYFAVHVQKLRFEAKILQRNSITLADLEFILRSMVNVEEVTFDKMLIDVDPKQLVLAVIRMPVLRKIILVDCDEDPADIILCVLEAPLLEAFYVQGYNEMLDFAEFFQRHKTIKNIAMSIAGILPNPQAFEHLQLSGLQFYFDSNLRGKFPMPHDVIARQPMLKYLNLLFDQNDVPYEQYAFDEFDVTRVTVNDETFTAVCRLTELESLKIVLYKVQPNTIEKIARLTKLKELVLIAIAEDDVDYESDYDYEVSKIRIDVRCQKCFQKLIATPLPKLESFTWSSNNNEIDYEHFLSSEEEEMMNHDREKEYSNLAKVNVAATMAPSFPLLKYLKIEMKLNVSINVREILMRFPHLETLQLATTSTFEGEPILTHEHIKRVKIREIEKHLLIEMLQSMSNLESLHIDKTNFSLDKVFLENLQSAVPSQLKEIKLNFTSGRHQDFAVENIVILQNIVENLQKCEIKLTGNCNFDSLAEKIDRSIHVSLPMSGDDIDDESYMQWRK
ncbi:hypothetical protein Bhyg_03910 [Pseudolycoriella hygida]|uniref:F-box domain-containing protein n=1 Tax=Pseudolycoriella hygida TaxID=35572 RepID=A0A9Q0NFP7_9DIPT|nr:hypothetical protein Bhyg_03910 [Pseudolycoriella hygida]